MIKDTNKRIAITLTDDELVKLNKVSEYKGISKSVIIKIALSEYLNKQGIRNSIYEKPNDVCMTCKEVLEDESICEHCNNRTVIFE